MMRRMLPSRLQQQRQPQTTRFYRRTVRTSAIGLGHSLSWFNGLSLLLVVVLLSLSSSSSSSSKSPPLAFLPVVHGFSLRPVTFGRHIQQPPQQHQQQQQLLLLLQEQLDRPPWPQRFSAPTTATTRTRIGTTPSLVVLFAAKTKKKVSTASLEALEALEEQFSAVAADDDRGSGDTPLSKKEMKELAKRKSQPQPQQHKKSESDGSGRDKQDEEKENNVLVTATTNGAMAKDDPASGSDGGGGGGNSSKQRSMSKKEEMLAKALALEAMDDEDSSASSSSSSSSSPYKDDTPKMTKKEIKELEKKEQRQKEKDEKKRQKKQEQLQRLQADENKVEKDDDDGDDDATEDDSSDLTVPNGSVVDLESEPFAPTDDDNEERDDDDDQVSLSGPTLEDKIRKERPPPRIRIMESTQPGYTSLRLENVGITFRNQQVLKDVTWGVQTGDRIGLVGANGAGKTTQLRILAGEVEPTVGDVVKSSQSVKVAMLRQEFVDELVLTRTLREEMMSVFGQENEILVKLKAVEDALAQMQQNDENALDEMQQLLDQMQQLQNEAEDKEVYVLESRVQKILDLMGFTAEEGDDLVASFSGGWKMRIGLGKVLLQDPNILLLDEPTNHLDLDSVEWLEAFLRQRAIPMVIVSHDREFLDQVCTKIVDAEGGICTEYDGNYSRFLQLKKARMDSWNAAYNAQEKKMKEERQWINKFRTKQPQAVKQREEKLIKFMKSDDYVAKPPFLGKPFRFRFPDAPRLSPEIADIKGMSHSYRSETTQNRLFDNVDLFVEKGDRIAVVGPNGSGKSTLLRLLTGRETPDQGSAAIVGQNIVMNFFEQNQADVLDLTKTVLETIQGASSGQSYNELRALLGQFLFKGDAVDKKVEYLSGGEKARLSLCCMMLKPANLLILDEPTNHLDISSCEMLEEALQHFTGSVIVVSHDRYFISKVATSIVAIEEKQLIKYQGDYKFYMEKSQAVKQKIEARYVTGVAKIESAPLLTLDQTPDALANKKRSFGGSNVVTRKDKGVKNAKRLQPK